jgi:hypothetical protein
MFKCSNKMKDLFKQAFQAGRDFGHAMSTGRPTHGLTFDEWYSENEGQVLSIINVKQSKQLCLACNKKPATHGIGETKTVCKKCWNKILN